MTDVGLMYVGAVLIVNGLVLLGKINGLAAAPLNLMVGALQTLVSLTLMFDPGAPAGSAFTAGGLLLFAFTYLWVGVNDLAGLPPGGFGWFSCFVAVAAAGMAVYSVANSAWVGVVQWGLWALLWWSFFVLLGLGRASWGRFTGGLAILAGIATTGIPGAASLAGIWPDSTALAVVLGAVCVVGVLWLLVLRRGQTDSVSGGPVKAKQETASAAADGAGP